MRCPTGAGGIRRPYRRSLLRVTTWIKMTTLPSSRLLGPLCCCSCVPRPQSWTPATTDSCPAQDALPPHPLRHHRLGRSDQHAPSAGTATVTPPPQVATSDSCGVRPQVWVTTSAPRRASAIVASQSSVVQFARTTPWWPSGACHAACATAGTRSGGHCDPTRRCAPRSLGPGVASGRRPGNRARRCAAAPSSCGSSRGRRHCCRPAVPSPPS